MLHLTIDKTFKELYLPSFAESVRAGAGAIMWWVGSGTLILVRTTRLMARHRAKMQKPYAFSRRSSGFRDCKSSANHANGSILVRSVRSAHLRATMAPRIRPSHPHWPVWTWNCLALITVSVNEDLTPDGNRLLEAVTSGQVPMHRLDDMARR